MSWRFAWPFLTKKSTDLALMVERWHALPEAVRAGIQAGMPAPDLLHLRVTLATTYLEGGRYREAEGVLDEAQKAAGPITGVSRADALARLYRMEPFNRLSEFIGNLPAILDKKGIR